MTYQEAVIELLRFCSAWLPVFKKYNSGWYGVESCTKCGKHKGKKVNMYILFPPRESPDSSVIVKCFRASCGHTGKISREDMEAMGFRNEEAIKVIDAHKGTRSVMRAPRSGEELSITSYFVNDPESFRYFGDRTMVGLDQDKVSEYRIVTDYKDIVKNNPFIPSRCADTILPIVSRNKLICFLTSKAKRLIIRSITGGFKCILPLDETGDPDYYVLKRYSTAEPNTVIVAEGIFDIINFANMNRNLEGVYMASLGIGSTEDMIVRETLDYDVVDKLVIVADSILDKYGKWSVDERYYIRLAKRIEDKFKEIYLVFNSSSKDFGDFREKITPSMIKLK